MYKLGLMFFSYIDNTSMWDMYAITTMVIKTRLDIQFIYYILNLVIYTVQNNK